MKTILEHVAEAKQQATHIKDKFYFLKRFTALFLVLFCFVFLIFGIAGVYLKIYSGRIYPGIYVGGYHVGKMSKNEVVSFLENMNNRLSKEGVDIEAWNAFGNKKNFKLNTIASEGAFFESVRIDSESTSNKVFAIGRKENWAVRLFYPIYLCFAEKKMLVDVKIDSSVVETQLADNLNSLLDAPKNAQIRIVNFSPLKYEISPERPGAIFEYDKIISNIQNNLSKLSFEKTVVHSVDFTPTIKTADAAMAAENLEKVLSYGNLNLNYINPQTNARRDWTIPASQYSDWLVVEKDTDDKPVLALDAEKAHSYLDELRAEVYKPAFDAKFVMEGGKVKEFQTSQTGLQLNATKTFNDLNTIFKERNYHPTETNRSVGLSLDIIEPKIKTSDTNGFGIEGVLGVGISTFKGSHWNRIKNIENAVSRLNGVIIKPGEEFSAIKYAGPFTIANGFLPELVIKGKEIKKEVGGGMCQIGTTLFRMAMNSGMDITERHNHSLVVNYYSDPVNGNPGTDASLYEPILDLKFLNDTGNYLLIQTEMDAKKQQLTFTLLGKPDGRSGSYSHPIVKKWMPPGERQNIYTDKLESGVEECQDAYTGAIASFTYTKINPSGEKTERIFDSYYRPLPKICRIGVDKSLCDSKGNCAQPEPIGDNSSSNEAQNFQISEPTPI
jgi:vancomycin resistance protein YoaR